MWFLNKPLASGELLRHQALIPRGEAKAVALASFPAQPESIEWGVKGSRGYCWVVAGPTAGGVLWWGCSPEEARFRKRENRRLSGDPSWKLHVLKAQPLCLQGSPVLRTLSTAGLPLLSPAQAPLYRATQSAPCGTAGHNPGRDWAYLPVLAKSSPGPSQPRTMVPATWDSFSNTCSRTPQSSLLTSWKVLVPHPFWTINNNGTILILRFYYFF